MKAGMYKQPSKLRQFILRETPAIIVLLLAALLLLVNVCLAEDVPPGCYVAESVRTDPCWQSQGLTTTWSKLPSNDSELYYGEVASQLLLACFDFRTEKQKAEKKFLRAKRLCGKRCKFLTLK